MGNEVCCLDDRSRNQPRAITSNERLGYGILQSTHYAESDAGVIRTNQTTAQETGRNNEAKLRQQLRDAGLKIVPIAGDGNCLFRALAHQLFGSDARHIEVRRACVAEMERDPDSYRPFLSDSEGVESRADFFKYLEDMRLPRRWGGHTELVAASRAYNVNIGSASLRGRKRLRSAAKRLETSNSAIMTPTITPACALCNFVRLAQ
jgi:hypothetical protein